MPELFELKTEWTQNAVNTSGDDSWGDTGIIPGVGEVDLGSCC
jgi:hypothetical protein